MDLFDNPFVIVDLETTGKNSRHARVTEIALIEVDTSGATSEWSTLVNPEVPIPKFTQALTGITDSMVTDAPSFTDLAQDLQDRLTDRRFVAHNAQFDYGFLRKEFSRAGYFFKTEALCTVRLPRSLYPQYIRHNLDSLIERHALPIDDRHRALADARAVWHFLNLVRSEFPVEILLPVINSLVQGSFTEEGQLDDEFSDLMNI